MKRFQIGVPLAFVFMSCSPRGCSIKNVPPEDQLHSYIDLMINFTQMEEKERLLELTCEPLTSAIAHLSDEAFKTAYMDQKFKFEEFKILERVDKSDKEIYLDFSLRFTAWQSGEDPQKAPLTNLENRATLKYELGRWALCDVESLKTDYVWKNGLPVMDAEGTDGPVVEIESSRENQGETPTESADEAPADAVPAETPADAVPTEATPAGAASGG